MTTATHYGTGVRASYIGTMPAASSGFLIRYWCKVSNSGNSDCVTWGQNDVGSYLWNWGIYATGGNWVFYNGGDNALIANDGGWYFWAVKVSSATTVSVGYTRTPGGAITWVLTNIAYNGGGFSFDGVQTCHLVNSAPLNGDLANLSICTGTATDSAISASSAITSPPPNCFAFWSNVGGDITKDWSGNGRNMTPEGSPTVASTAPDWPTTLNILCGFDSLVTAVGGATPWPTQLAALRPSDTVATAYAAGTVAAYVAGSAAADLAAARSSTLTNVYVVEGGLNDIWIDGTNGPTTVSLITSLVTLAKQAGYTVWFCDMLDQGDATSPTTYPTQHAAVDYVNANATSVGAFGVVLVSAVLNDGANTTYMLLDTDHPTTAGHALWAAAVNTALGSTATSNTGTAALSSLAVDGTGSAAIVVSGSGSAAMSPVAATGAAVRTGRGIRYIGAGTTIYSTASGTSVAPTYPGSLAANDLLVLLIGQKPSTANGGTVTTPSGWTLQGSLTGAGGYSTTLGVDTGNTNIFVYTKNSVAGTESGALTVTVGTNGVCWGSIQAFRAGSGQWSIAVATGSDTSAGDVSITLGSDPGVIAYDAALVAMCIPTDVTTPSQFTSEAITQTGVTYGTVVEISEPDSSTGNDIGGLICWCPVASGTSSAAPVFTATVAGTNTNVRGPLAFIRIRELGTDGLATGAASPLAVSGSGTTGDTAPTGTGSIAISSLASSGSGSVALSGSGSVALSAVAVSGTGTHGASTPITNRTTTSLPTTSDGFPQLDWAEAFGNRLGFKDIGATGSGHLIVLARTTNYLWLYWSTDGTTWTPVQLMALPETTARIRAICQSDDGKIHLILFRGSYGEINYHRFTPSYTSGTMSSFSQDTTWSILLSAINGDTRYDMQEVVTSDESKYIAALCSTGDGSLNLKLIMTVFPRTATSAAALKGIDGTGASTVLTTGVYNGGNSTNHDHAGLFTQNKSTKALIISVGFTEAEMPLAEDDIYHYFAATSGATTWSTSTLVQEVNTHPYCVCGHYAVGANVYRARLGDSTTPTVRIDKIDSTGAITYDAFPSFSATAVGGDYSGWVVIGISNDEAIAYVTSHTYWDTVKSGSCVGGTWTLTNEPGSITAYGVGGFGHSRGVVAITAGQPGTVNSAISSVWDSTIDAVSISGSGSAAFIAIAVSGSGLEAFTSSGSIALSQLAFSGSGLETFASSGSVALSQFAVGGSGIETFTGSATVAQSSLAASGSGLESFSGTGSLALSQFAATGSATVTCTGSGSAAIQPLAISGSGNQSAGIAGSCSIALASFACSGIGQETFSGTGSIAVQSLAVSAAGLESYVGSGSGALSPIAVVGIGSESYIGAASVAFSSLAVSGSALESFTGSGTTALATIALAATGNQAVGTVGSGSVAISSLSVSATGTESYIGSGAAQLPSNAIGGSGATLSPVSGLGTVAISGISSSGIAVESFVGSGSVTLQSLAGNGSAIQGVSGTGSLSLASLGLSGSGTVSYTGTAEVQLRALAVSATGSIVPPSVSGSGSAQIVSIGIVGSGFVGLVGPGTIARHNVGYGTIDRSNVSYGTIDREQAL